MFGGIVLEKMGMAKYVADWLKTLQTTQYTTEKDTRKLIERIPEINKGALQTFKKLLPYIFIGIGIGSFIHGYVPESFF